jgi:hypothetical protein
VLSVAKKKQSLVHRLLYGDGSRDEADRWRTCFLRGGKLFHFSPGKGYYPASRSCKGKIVINVCAYQLLGLPVPAEA